MRMPSSSWRAMAAGPLNSAAEGISVSGGGNASLATGAVAVGTGDTMASVLLVELVATELAADVESDAAGAAAADDDIGQASKNLEREGSETA